MKQLEVNNTSFFRGVRVKAVGAVLPLETAKFGGTNLIQTNGLEFSATRFGLLGTQPERVSWLIAKDLFGLSDAGTPRPVASWQEGFSHWDNYSSRDPDSVPPEPNEHAVLDGVVLAESYGLSRQRFASETEEYSFDEEYQNEAPISITAREGFVLEERTQRNGLATLPIQSETSVLSYRHPPNSHGSIWAGNTWFGHGYSLGSIWLSDSGRLTEDYQNLRTERRYSYTEEPLLVEFWQVSGSVSLTEQETLSLNDSGWISVREAQEEISLSESYKREGQLSLKGGEWIAFKETGSSSKKTERFEWNLAEHWFRTGLSLKRSDREEISFTESWQVLNAVSAVRFELKDSGTKSGLTHYTATETVNYSDWGGIDQPSYRDTARLNETARLYKSVGTDTASFSEGRQGLFSVTRTEHPVLQDTYRLFTPTPEESEWFELRETHRQSGFRTHRAQLRHELQDTGWLLGRANKHTSESFSLRELWRKTSYIQSREETRLRDRGWLEGGELHLTEQDTASLTEHCEINRTQTQRFSQQETFRLSDTHRVSKVHLLLQDTASLTERGYIDNYYQRDTGLFREQYRWTDAAPSRTDKGKLEEQWSRHGRTGIYQQQEILLETSYARNGSRAIRAREQFVLDERYIRPSITQHQQEEFYFREQFSRNDHTVTERVILTETARLEEFEPDEWIRLSERWNVLGRGVRQQDSFRFRESHHGNITHTRQEHASLRESRVLVKYKTQADTSQLQESHRMLSRNDFLLVTPEWYSERPKRRRGEVRINKLSGGEYLAVWKDTRNALRRAVKTGATWNGHVPLDPVELPATAEQVSASRTKYCYKDSASDSIYWHTEGGMHVLTGENPIMSGEGLYWLSTDRRLVFYAELINGTPRKTLAATLPRKGYLRQTLAGEPVLLDSFDELLRPLSEIYPHEEFPRGITDEDEASLLFPAVPPTDIQVIPVEGSVAERFFEKGEYDG